MFTRFEEILIASADQVPLEIFAFASSFIEEVLAPIPSPAVMMLTGSIASLQGRPFYNLFILCLLGAVGKLLGAIIVYFIADKVEDIFSWKLAKFFGVTHEDIESFGKRLGDAR
jgi:membrane protein DedA with SNARE-associated domain